MQSDTLTTVGQLKPGDIFCLPVRGIEILFVKKDDQVTRDHNKHLFHCTAIVIETMQPKPFKKNTTVTFKKSNPSFLTKIHKP